MREHVLGTRVAVRALSSVTYTADEMMAVEAARRLHDGTVCFVGIGLPSLAANLARRTHAPDCVLVYESGTIGAKPLHLPLSIGDGELAETADAVVSVPEMFAYWLQGGRIDVGFLGRGADRPARQPEQHRDRRLRRRRRCGCPGGGGAPEIAAACRETLRHAPPDAADVRRAARLPHDRRVGDGRSRELGSRARRRVITDLGVLEPARRRADARRGCTRASSVERRGRRPAGRCASPTTLAGRSLRPTAELDALRALQT